MPSRQNSIVQEDFGAGIVRDVAPHLIPRNGAYDIVDALLEEDGSPFRRGGTEYKSGAAFGTGLRFIWDGYLDVGQRTLVANESDFGVLAANDTDVTNLGGDGMPFPKPAVVLESLLFIGGGYIYGGSRKTAAYSAGTVAVTNGSATVTKAAGGFTANADAGMLFQIGNERVYVVASVDSDTQITLRDAYAGTTAGAAAYTLHNVYTITAADPYPDSDSYAAAAGRLIATTTEGITFSEIENPHKFTLTVGAEEIPNEHVPQEGVEMLGVQSIGQNVLLFHTGGTSVLQGIAFDIVDDAGNGNHRLSILSRDLVLFGGPAGIASWENLLVVPCTNGIYLMDGVSSPVQISRSIGPLYLRHVSRPRRCGLAVVSRDHYFLPIINTADEVSEHLVCHLDRAVTDRRRRTTFPWTRFSAEGGDILAYALRIGTSTQEPLLLGAESGATSRIVDCGAFFEPDGQHKQDAGGTVHTLEIITRDYETGNLTKNHLRSIRTRYELLDAASDQPLLQFGYSDGSVGAGGALWGEAIWGTDLWSAAVGAGYADLECPGPEDNGTNPHRCRVNKFRRFLRFRITSDGPCASCVIRSLELFVRPSKTVRH